MMFLPKRSQTKQRPGQVSQTGLRIGTRSCCRSTSAGNVALKQSLSCLPGAIVAVIGLTWCQPTVSQTLILDNFDQGLNSNWVRFDLNIAYGDDGQPLRDKNDQPLPRPWGPGIFDVSSGALNLRTSGPLPPRSSDTPYNSFDSGNLAVLWGPSATDGQFSNGFARSTLRIDSPGTATAFWLRGNLESNQVYVLGGSVRGDGSPGPFAISLFDNGAPARGELIPELRLPQGEEWMIEASSMGSFLALKAWPAHEREPWLPQLTLSDSTSTMGQLGLGAGLSAGEALDHPTQVNVTRDQISFSPVLIPEFSGMVVFGDSLTDVGNVLARSPGVIGRAVPASPPYFAGRLSNGPVWVERLAERLGIESPTASENGGNNFAWGGATTGSIENTLGVDDMNVQIEKYLDEQTPDASQLFVLYGGSNDISRGESPEAPVREISNHITSLAKKGAANFLVPNMAPPVNDHQQDGLGKNVEFNTLLSGALSELRDSLGVTIYEVDIAQMIGELVHRPQAFGFSDISNPACSDCGAGLGPSSQVVPDPDEHLLWDNVHYSGRANQILGDGAFLSLVLPGDVNHSGRIDSRDIDLISQALRNRTGNSQADVNLDGAVTAEDRTFWLEQYGRTQSGDANLDGTIDFRDFLALSAAFGQRGGWRHGDFDGDGVVDFPDFVVLSNRFGSTAERTVAIPEPHACRLLVIGALSCLLLRRRSAQATECNGR